MIKNRKRRACVEATEIDAQFYRIAGNFRGVKYSLFSWAGRPLRNFNVGVAYRTQIDPITFSLEDIHKSVKN